MSKRPGRVNVEVTIGNRRRFVGGGKDIQSRGSARTKAPGGSILGMTKEGLGDRVARLRAGRRA